MCNLSFCRLAAAAPEELPCKRRRLSEDASSSRGTSPTADAAAPPPLLLERVAAPRPAASPSPTSPAAALPAPAASLRRQQPPDEAGGLAFAAHLPSGQQPAQHSIPAAPPAAFAQPQPLQNGLAAVAFLARQQQPGHHGERSCAAAGQAIAPRACGQQLNGVCNGNGNGNGLAHSIDGDGIAGSGGEPPGSDSGDDGVSPTTEKKPYLCTGFDCYVVRVCTCRLFRPLSLSSVERLSLVHSRCCNRVVANIAVYQDFVFHLCITTDVKLYTGLVQTRLVFLPQEPCAMCAMALVHSRVRRVVYCVPDPRFGALGSRYRLHGQRSLNHHYLVFRLPLTDGELVEDGAIENLSRGRSRMAQQPLRQIPAGGGCGLL